MHKRGGGGDLEEGDVTHEVSSRGKHDSILRRWPERFHSSGWRQLGISWPAVTLKLFGFISAVKEASLEELHSHHSKDEHEEQVDNQDVEHILQRVHHTVKHSLRNEKENNRARDLGYCMKEIHWAEILIYLIDVPYASRKVKVTLIWGQTFSVQTYLEFGKTFNSLQRS